MNPYLYEEETLERIRAKEVLNYYYDEYRRMLNFDVIENRRMRDYFKSLDLRVWSHLNRFTLNVQIMKITYIFKKTGLITVCYKATLHGTSAIYAFMYLECQGTKVRPAYVCTGPAFRSQDGEYRSRLITWRQYEQLLQFYKKELAEVEPTVISKLTDGSLSFQTDLYYPSNCHANRRKVEDLINTLRTPINFYMLCWLVDYHNIYHKIAENHINPAYQYIFSQKDDLPVFKKLYNRLKYDGFSMLINRISSAHLNVALPDYNLIPLGCGQKIFPVTAIEAIRMDDINFDVWREIYITDLASNLVLNLISPCFPFINNWFYIQNAHAGLFDNYAMHEKFAHSEIATDISEQLRKIDKLNYIDRDPTKQPISSKFYTLSRHVHKAMVYADSDIKLSDLAICVTGEYVGRTLRDLPTLIANKQTVPGLELTFTDHKIFRKHIFEFIYSFYCMNTKIGIIHGDLHMNNVTISWLYNMFSHEGKLYVADPHIAYILGQDIYVFKHYGTFSTVIDFSRAIVGDYKRIEHEFSERFAVDYFNKQRRRILFIIYHYFPKLLEKSYARINDLLDNNFTLMFKILSCIDTYVLCSNILAMFNIDNAFTKGKINLAPGATKLLTNITDMAERLFTTNMNAAIEGRIFDPDSIEWPNLLILKANFKENLVDENIIQRKDVNICDVFNYNNEVVYDIEDYDSWAPPISPEKNIEVAKKYGIQLEDELVNWLAMQRMDESKEIDALTSRYEQEEFDSIKFEPWMSI